MAERSPAVDAYIARASPQARPILERIRNAFHAGCPGLEERIKWGVPSFEYRGMLGGMAAFKRHVSFGFWRARRMADPEGLFAGQPRASPMGIRVSSLADLPPRKVLVAYVRQARRLNLEGAKQHGPGNARKAPRVVVPADLAAALAGNPRARRTFDALPPGARRDYVEWLLEAKRPQTRARRRDTAIEWLAQGKRRNWKYERRS